MQLTRTQYRLSVTTVLTTALLQIAACGGDVLEGRPTVTPVIRLTPAPTQDVRATQTAYALRSIPTPTPAGLYIVRPGDTLSKIADAFETTVDEIIAINGIADPNRIEVGQQLIIPSLAKGASPAAESSPPAP
ncbi:MAG: LysM peptidoglycan-binding domain-containing protein [Chloroflexota bacterium]|nr:LysM peptidoglycan-binding domain-containing protein [Chloroflexota bacterium]